MQCSEMTLHAFTKNLFFILTDFSKRMLMLLRVNKVNLMLLTPGSGLSLTESFHGNSEKVQFVRVIYKAVKGMFFDKCPD